MKRLLDSMDLGLGFDDSDFERKEKTTAGTKTSYNARVCNPLVSIQYTQRIRSSCGLPFSSAFCPNIYRTIELQNIPENIFSQSLAESEMINIIKDFVFRLLGF